MINAIIGWFALTAILLYFIGLFYVDISAKKIFKRIGDIQLQGESLLTEAKSIRDEGFYSRIKWLKANQERFPEDLHNETKKTLTIYFGCWILMGILVACWLVMLFLQ